MNDRTAGAGSRSGAAFFDLDRTLIAGSSAFALATAARSMKMMPTARVAPRCRHRSDVQVPRRPRQLGRRQRRAIGCSGSSAATARTTCSALNEQVLPTLLGKIRPEARRLVDLHRHAGRATYIVSAAPQEIVEPLALALGMTGGIGTRRRRSSTASTPANSTGRSATARARSTRSSRSLARWEGSTSPSATGTATRPATCRCSSAVGHPVAVNPDGKLERHARTHGWPVVIFSERTKTVIRRTAAGVASTGLAAGTFVAGMEFGGAPVRPSPLGR